VDILEGILATVKQLEEGRYEVENKYARAVSREGNVPAQEMINRVYEVTDRKWRGIGTIPASGMKIKEEYSQFDAALKFKVGDIRTEEPSICISGEILQGTKKPPECPAFGKECTMEHPLGATMVSSEGACAAYFSYKRDFSK
jgi:hydrogenase expression/formation protein HypD